MAELKNEFSWSRSRDNAFQECKRKYFYHYYGAWGGWDAAAPQEVRRLSPDLLPPAAHRRNPQDDARALVDRALVEGLRLREHGGVGRARLRFLDGAGAPGARGLEDGRDLP